MEIELVAAYRQYTDDVAKKIEAAERRLGKEMLEEIKEKTPVGSHTYKGLKHRYRRTERRVPGQMRKDWKLKVTKRDGGLSVKAHAGKGPDSDRISPSAVYSSGLVHLLDLGHRMPRGGEYRGSGFVTDIQKKYREKLHAEIERILSET